MHYNSRSTVNHYSHTTIPCLSCDQYVQLINTIESQVIRLMTETILFTGLRISETVNLRIGDVDLEDDRLLVRYKRFREIPLHPSLRNKLQTYLVHDRGGTELTAPLFVRRGGGGISPSYYNFQLHRASKKLGWNRTITATVLRHTFATNLFNAGTSISVVSLLLGHRILHPVLIPPDLTSLRKEIVPALGEEPASGDDRAENSDDLGGLQHEV